MHSTSYYLTEEDYRQIIVHEATELAVQNFSLGHEPYTPRPEEIDLFGDDHGEWLAFETIRFSGCRGQWQVDDLKIAAEIHGAKLTIS